MFKVKWLKEHIEPAVKSSTTWAEVAIKMGTKPFTGNQSHLRKRAIFYEIDFSHFKSRKNWSKGLTRGPKKPVDYYLTHSTKIGSSSLRNKLIESGLKESKCERCKIIEWLGGPVPLELDHINSDHFDNRLENLMILCPNCHAAKDYSL